MKLKSITSLFILFLFISFSTINAATITWLGGNAAWDDASQWDTGTIPSYGDDVVIPSGYCKVYGGDAEGATSVQVQSSGRLYIFEGGQLEIQGAVDNDGLHNLGRVYIYGSLAINDITRTVFWYSANAIRNERYIFTYSQSNITIKYIDDEAIDNHAANSYFRNRGYMSFYSIDNLAIRNQDRFYNYGTIDIQNSGGMSNTLLVNSDTFRNYSDGVINLKSDIYSAINNSAPSGNFINDGEISIDDVNYGLINMGNFTNSEDASINISESTIAIQNRIGSSITNSGYISINQTEVGIENLEEFVNYGKFHVFNSGYSGGIQNRSNAIVENYGTIYLNANQTIDIDNDGDIYNYNGAYFLINKSLILSTGSSFSNYGFFISYGSNNHVFNGSFGNKGVIDDNNGDILPYISNDRVVVAPISGPMQVGVPYSNVLDVASLQDVEIGDWKVTQNGALAGNYDPNTNEFIPYASAVGLSIIYISIRDLQTRHNRNFTLEIDSPILPFTKKGGTSATRADFDQENTFLKSTDIKVYPNPTNGTIQLESDVFENQQTQIHVFNSLGQLVQNEQLSSGNKNQTLDFSSDLKSGIYFVKILKEGTEIDVKRVHLTR